MVVDYRLELRLILSSPGRTAADDIFNSAAATNTVLCLESRGPCACLTSSPASSSPCSRRIRKQGTHVAQSVAKTGCGSGLVACVISQSGEHRRGAERPKISPASAHFKTWDTTDLLGSLSSRDSTEPLAIRPALFTSFRYVVQDKSV